MEAGTSTVYQIDQRVVYPSQGVGRILEIREKSFKDTKVLYYIIYLEFSDMTVMVPTEKADSLGLRPIVAKDEAERALANRTDAMEVAQAQAQLAQALAQLQALERLRRALKH